MKTYAKYAFSLIILILLFIFVYPTLYKYDKYDQKIPIRINRITGKTEIFSLEGWSIATAKPLVAPTPSAKPSPTPSPTPTVFNGETFQQYYDRVIKEVADGSAPSKNTLYLRWERARLGLSDKLVEPKDYFTIGSTKEEVKQIMGTPDSINTYFDTWDYSGSSITFSNGKVKEYNDSGNKLLVR